MRKTRTSVIKLQTRKIRHSLRPLNYHARTEHSLPNELNPAQAELDEIFKLAEENKMIVNKKKTKTMIFNSSKLIDFEPFLVDP